MRPQRSAASCITGFGHFGVRVEVDGLLYFKISLNGRAANTPDPQSKVLHSEDNYLLLTFTRTAMTIVIKSLDGRVLDRVEVSQK